MENKEKKPVSRREALKFVAKISLIGLISHKAETLLGGESNIMKSNPSPYYSGYSSYRAYENYGNLYYCYGSFRYYSYYSSYESYNSYLSYYTSYNVSIRSSTYFQTF